MTEWMLRDVAAVSDMRVGILRYFNVAGADAAGRSGEWSEIASHLIKIACEVASGKREKVVIFGDDYDTPDGTCVRDYIHVSDLANAHLRTLDYLISEKSSAILNCGYGQGFSVKDVLQEVERVMGKPLNIEVGERRLGDPPELVCDPSLLKSLTGWQPEHNDLNKIISSALEWEKSLS